MISSNVALEGVKISHGLIAKGAVAVEVPLWDR